MRPSASTLEHVGEWRVGLRAGSLEALFAELARVVARSAGQPAGDPGPWERVTLSARDEATLFVDWANELVGRAEIERCAFDAVRELEIRLRDGELELVAEVRGRAVPRWRSPLKAATYHDAVVERRGDAWRGEVLFDV
ncbi:MAG TPA: archease [Gemmatimonadaceae bacterium]